VKQTLCRFDEEKRRAMGEEIHKLLAAEFIKEVFHPKWLACPKVPYPLPRIETLCCFDEEKRRAMGEEIHKLLAAEFIKEVFHHKWLACPKVPLFL
jgi:5-carboxymethyl-2-hydroxymuconate isomerase